MKKAIFSLEPSMINFKELVKGRFILRQEVVSLVFGRMICWMGLVFSKGKSHFRYFWWFFSQNKASMERSLTKALGKMTNHMDVEYIFIKMERSTADFTMMENSLEKANTFTQMAGFFRGFSKMAKSTVRERNILQKQKILLSVRGKMTFLLR